MPAAGLTEVGARDTDPLVLGGRGQHPAQKLAVPPLGLGPLAQRPASGRDPGRQRIAHLLELLEAGDARLAERSGHPGLDRQPRKGLCREAGELALEPTDLAPQLGTGKALVGSRPERREPLSIEQIRHRSRV
jgi:hypothetical protein